MSDEKDQLIDEALSLADKLFRQLLPTVPHELLSLEVTMPQLKIMLLLYLRGAMRMSDLAGNLEVTLPTATSLVEKLVDKNFVTRINQQDDRRVVMCRLSQTGQKAIARIWETARVNCVEILDKLDVSKIQMLAEVLKAMVDMQVDIKSRVAAGQD